MRDFHFIREGDRFLFSLQAFKITGSVPNFSIGAGGWSAPRFVICRNFGGSVMASGGSGTGGLRVKRSTNAASGKYFVSGNASVTSGFNPGPYPMALIMKSTAAGNQVKAEFNAGFVVIQGQAR